MLDGFCGSTQDTVFLKSNVQKTEMEIISSVPYVLLS
jgi:hypothetical protein